jgi:anti-sigma factor RsiW
MKMSETNHDHRECRDLFARMSEYLDGEVEPAVRRRMEQHLDNCRPCRICLLTLQRTAVLCREMSAAQVPKEVSRRLKEFFTAMTGGRA